MNKDLLIQKWLDHNLDPKELKAFEALKDYEDLTRLNTALKQFKTHEYNTEFESSRILAKIRTSNAPKKHMTITSLLKTAAILVLCFGTYFYTTTLDSKIYTDLGEKIELSLPDDSSVLLNADSKLVYNENSWSKERAVELSGEAFFKVAQGETFEVITPNGIITVLGTKFNVKQRQNIFEVICYEGLVAVTLNKEQTKLYPGDTFLLVNGKRIVNEKENSQQPSWITDESSFRSIPLYEVFNELERQYGVSVKYDLNLIDSEKLFTGRFTHKNLDIALKSVTLPLHLSYQKVDNSIILTRDQ